MTYDAASVGSKRIHHERAREILHHHGTGIRVYELQGELMFGSTDSVIKAITQLTESVTKIVVDFGRVMEMDHSSMRLLADFAAIAQGRGRSVFYTGTEDKFVFRRFLVRHDSDLDAGTLLKFSDKDRALEWCEDLLIEEQGGTVDMGTEVPLEEQYLCESLSAADITYLREAGKRRQFAKGEVIFRAGDAGDSLYLILSGRVEIVVRAKGGRDRRLATVRSGMSFGEFALVSERSRSAEARAAVDTTCFELALDDIDDSLRTRFLVAVAKELSRRLSKEAFELQVLEGRS